MNILKYEHIKIYLITERNTGPYTRYNFLQETNELSKHNTSAIHLSTNKQSIQLNQLQ